MLKDKNIVLGVCGGIAAYKSVDIVSRLKKLGANVYVVMTDSAQKFVTPLTFQSISQNYVVSDMFESPKTWDIEHIALAKKADLFLIAPATANLIGKVANGIADDMLSTTIMATRAPVIFAPAMNVNMYNNPLYKENEKKLETLGYRFIEPLEGRLACGDIGKGKMAEPETIVNTIVDFFSSTSKMKGVNIVVTAGPTREEIDPVRFISNYSSGKMGFAIAKIAAERGANVTLISGPVGIHCPQVSKFVPVKTTEEMYNAVTKEFETADVVIKAAAVADYRPKSRSSQKIKKSDQDFTIELEKNVDILKELGKIKGNKLLVGFAAETDDIVHNAIDKINKKNLDMIVANDITAEGAGFNVDTNIVKIIDKKGAIEDIPLCSKEEVAGIILDKICDLLKG